MVQVVLENARASRAHCTFLQSNLDARPFRVKVDGDDTCSEKGIKS